MIILRDPSKSTSDKNGIHFKYEEMKNLNIPFSQNPKDFFQKFGINTTNLPSDWNYESLDSLGEIWENVKHEIAKNDMFDENAKKSISNAKLEELGVQKVTYSIDEKEDLNKIFEELKTNQTGAIFRAVVRNDEDREIEVYTSRFGIWKDPNESYRAKLNTGSESNGKIRSSFTARGQKDINSFINIDKGFNYSVYEDTVNLFEKKLIDNIDNKITELHYKISDLSEDEIKSHSLKTEAAQVVKVETSHTNKEVKETNAKTNEMIETIEKNEEEIKTLDEREISIDRADTVLKYQEERDKLIVDFSEKLLQDLKEKQALELAVLQEKINSIAGARIKLKQDAILLLQNGMNLQNMNTELSSKKYNEIQIQIINEEFKKEIIDSIEKENELKKISKELVVLEDKFEKTDKSKIFFKEQYQGLQIKVREEVEKHNLTKIHLMNTLKNLENSTNEFENQKQLLLATVHDLKEEKVSLKEELDIIEAEIEEKVEVIYEQKETISKQSQTINVKEEKIQDLNKNLGEQKQLVVYKDEKIEDLNSKNIHLEKNNSTLENELKNANEKIESLVDSIEKERKQTKAVIQSLKSTNKEMFEENTQLKEQLADYAELKKELENFKKNSEINSSYKQKVEESKSEIKKDEELIEEVKKSDIYKSKLDGLDEKKYDFNFPGMEKKKNFED